MKPPVFELLRDGVLLAPRMLAGCIDVVRGRRRARRSHRLREPVSLAWLAGALGVPEGAIGAARVEELHSGTATRSTLRVAYRGEPSAGSPPAALFIKSDPPGFGAALFGVLLELGRNEVSFYREIRPSLPIPAPRVWHSEGDSRCYEILMEDLAAQGCEFSDLAKSCTREQAYAIVRTLGRLHAHYWESERFAGDLAWVNRPGEPRNDRLLNFVRNLSVPVAVRRYGGSMPAEVVAALPELLVAYPRLEALWGEGPLTLIHGDAHLGNMYFRGEEVGLLDWQVQQRGQGMRDVAYFLVNSLTESMRRAEQDGLIRAYLECLAEGGVRLPFETAWRQYRLQSVYAWIAGIVTAPSDFQPPEIVEAGIARSCAAIVDLEVVALLRELGVTGAGRAAA